MANLDLPDNPKEYVRTFVAIELPDAVRKELGKLTDALTTAEIPGVRPVGLDGVHLTLKFLGDVESERLEAVAEAISKAAAGHSPFKLDLGSAGAFPDFRKPRVLWIGVGGNLEALASLQADVEGALDNVGFAKDGRGYNPHLTLARVRNGSPPSSGRRAGDILKTTPLRQGLEFAVDRISLMRTELHPDGAVHSRVVSLPL